MKKEETINVSPYVYPGLGFAKREVAKKGMPTREYHADQQKRKLEFIFKRVCKLTDVSADELRSKWRKREVVQARQIFCYLSTKYTECIYVDIGGMINRDHSTVMHSCKICQEVNDRPNSYPELFNKMYQIDEDIYECGLKVVNKKSRARKY